jgi:hypothetical protein
MGDGAEHGDTAAEQGPALAAFTPSGIGVAQTQCARTRSPKPPWPETMSPLDFPQTLWWPERHCSQAMQLLWYQPMPTRSPTFTRFASGPTATTRPMASWPGTSG